MKRIPALALILAAGCVSTSTFKAQEKAAADAKALNVSLMGQMNDVQAKLAATAKDLDAAKAQVDQLTKTQADLKSSADATSARLTETSAKLASANDQVASLQKSGADLQKALEANKGELSRKVAELVKDKDAVAQKLASTERAAAEAKAAGERQAADMTRADADLQANLRDLQAKLADLEKAKASLESEKAALQKQKDDELAATKKSYEGMMSGLKAEIQNGEVTISNLQGKLTVNMVDRILFDSGSAEVKPAGRKILARVGEVLNTMQDKDIRIEGHTDNVPISAELAGRYASNWELSTARATAVARYLQDHAKVDPKRLIAAGLGEWRPVASNDTSEHRALNRRIEIILVARD